MSSADGGMLYNPGLLALAVSLADYPLDEALPLRSEARSRTCGSVLAFACDRDAHGRIERPGVRVSACAVGQAAAAIFVSAAAGRTSEDVERALDQTERWLAGGGPLPDWPGINALAAACAYPGRHGAMLLPWRAAREALCNTSTES